MFASILVLCFQNEIPSLPSQSIRSTGCRFARRDPCRTWNTGNFGPDAICFSVDRPGIAIAGAAVYYGTGSYEYQLELLYDALESPAGHKWETLESISGTYDQDSMNNDMVELKFERPVHIKVMRSKISVHFDFLHQNMFLSISNTGKCPVCNSVMLSRCTDMFR